MLWSCCLDADFMISKRISFFCCQLQKTLRASSLERRLRGQSFSATAVLSHQKLLDHPVWLSRHFQARNPADDLQYFLSHITDRRSKWLSSRQDVNQYNIWRSSGGERH